MGIDLVGSAEKMVALVEIDDGSGKSTSEIVEEITKRNKNVRSVLEKYPGTTGKFRMKSYRLIWGEDDTEVFHREHGYVIKVDPRRVYFSPRESTVRQRICRQVKPDERVLVMFAGAGPYPICASKLQPKVSEVVGVDLNPKAVEYMKENARINKVSHLVTPILGDVREYCKAAQNFDRIIMPMIEAVDFLEDAASCAESGAVVHMYMVSSSLQLFKDCERKIEEKMRGLGRKYEVLGESKISLYAPGKWKVLMEIRLK